MYINLKNNNKIKEFTFTSCCKFWQGSGKTLKWVLWSTCCNYNGSSTWWLDPNWNWYYDPTRL